MRTAEALRNAITGLLMGIFMMMPGASGATMAVVFGVYERLIRDISRLREFLIKDVGFLLTLGLGGVLGVLICAKGLDFLIESYEIPIMFFFAALISVQVPDIAQNVKEDTKPTAYNILAFVMGVAIMLVILYVGTLEGGDEKDYGIIGMFIAGILYAICALSPGISGSTILLALGLLTPVLDGLSGFHLSKVLPIILGAVVGVLCFAKLIDHFVTNNRRSTYSAILGLTVGSIITVVAQGFLSMDGGDYLLPCIIGIVLGAIVGWGIHIFSTRYAPESE